jgi:DHA1 family bicyclomycin/chloramphenicol resistance-like MFS transporter
MSAAISDGRRQVGRPEFTAVLAYSMALTALGIDLMLPAFGAIRADLGLPADSTAVAGLVTAYFVGLAVGQLAYGPVADRFGRRPVLFAGFVVYGLAALLTALAPSLPLLLAARFVWGVGAASPRVVALAMVRDAFEGEQMARTMSMIFAVFILAPVVAPTIGATIVGFASWRWLFGVCAAAATVVALWATRLPETLDDRHRMPLRFDRVASATRFVVSNRQAVGYGLAMTALYGVFTSYLGSAELIFGDTFDSAGIFPYLFGGVAAFMGLAMVANARIVERVGTRRLGHITLLTYVAMACGLVGLAVATGGRPPLWTFVIGVALMLGAHALLIPNFNTIAMDQLASVAGTASSVIGAVQIAGGATLGAQLDRAFDGTILPISYGFLGYGIVALGLVVWAERGRLFQPLAPPAPDGDEPTPLAAEA